jgi:hypothetical protein
VCLGRSAKGGVHRFVAAAFLGVPEDPDMEAAHRNGNSLDNSSDNIVWATKQENEAHKCEHGTSFRYSVAGQYHPKAKLSDADVMTIRSKLCGRRGELQDIAAEMGVSRSTIGRIASGKTWGHLHG